VTGRSIQAQARSKRLAAEARANGYGPTTPRDERNKAVHNMAGNGMMHSDIAAVFGVTYETVRKVLRSVGEHTLTGPEWQLIRLVREGNLTRAAAQLGSLLPQQGDDSDDRQ
jgi:DNA-binding NarL/FixJ family response regulator